MKEFIPPRQASQPNLWGYRLASMAMLGLLLFNLPGPLGDWRVLSGLNLAVAQPAGLQGAQPSEPDVCPDNGTNASSATNGVQKQDGCSRVTLHGCDGIEPSGDIPPNDSRTHCRPESNIPDGASQRMRR